MVEVRKGLQTPTQSVVLPYEDTFGNDAIKLYNKSRKNLMEWQENLIRDMLAIRPDGLFTHQKFGIAIPRRNGKSELVIAVVLWAINQGYKTMYTAHRSQTSRAIWERAMEILLELGHTEDDFKIGKQFGMEYITDKATGGRVQFRTRTQKGGLGEGYDILIIDEAQEYTTDQEQAIKYVVSDSPNPITIMIGTPPTTISSGTVFSNFRTEILKGNGGESGWAEWSVENQVDVFNREYWYQTNPSLGTILTERKILAEITGDDLDFNIQRLGYWIKYNIKSAISEAEWDELKMPRKPTKTDFEEGLWCGVKYGKDGTNVSLAIAIKLTDDRGVFIEALGCKPIREGNEWILKYLKALKPEAIVIDGAGGQKILEEEINALRLGKVILPTVKEIVVANAKFEQAITKKAICHYGQPSLRAVASNCDKRAIGTGGGFGYQSLKAGLDISLLDSVILAYWQASEGKAKKKQRFSY